jgi:phage shock protein C
MYRLRKVTGKEARVFGVCAGISKYINPDMDPVALRILWVIISIFALPFMVFLYLALAIVLKPEDYVIKKTEEEAQKEKEDAENQEESTE